MVGDNCKRLTEPRIGLSGPVHTLKYFGSIFFASAPETWKLMLLWGSSFRLNYGALTYQSICQFYTFVHIIVLYI